MFAMGHKAKGIMIMYKELLFWEYQQNKFNQRKKQMSQKPMIAFNL